MIKYMSTGSNKSSQFANDQIIHHIAVSSQPPVGYQNLQNFHLSHGLATRQLNSNSLLTNLSLNMTKSASQLSSPTGKQLAKSKSDEERKRKSLELEVNRIFVKYVCFSESSS